MPMKSIRNINVLNKRILLRVDLNVSLDQQGQVLDDFRIRASLPTIEYLITEQAKVILMSHLGKPEGKVVEKLKLTPIQDRLMEYLDLSVVKAPDCVGQEIEDWTYEMQPTEILLLENLRFHKEEETNDENFAKNLAKLGDIYVNDAFGVCHRAHASVKAITQYLPSFAGLLLEKEIKILKKVLERPKRPLMVIIGGVKISTKIKLIQKFLKIADQILLGGALANTVLNAQGIATGKSLIEPMMIPEIKKLQITNTKLHLPVDAKVSTGTIGQKLSRITAIGKTGKNELILDIGPETEELFSQIIKKAKTIIWNGPMGFFEKELFAHGTEAIAKSIIESNAYSIVGGGETVAYIEKLGLVDKFSHVSTGGGAMLEFLTGEKLPGLKALE